MKILQVNYRRENGQDDAEQAARLQHDAENIAQLPGLVWKVWMDDDEQQRAGGLYLFDSEEHARAFGDGILPKALAVFPASATSMRATTTSTSSSAPSRAGRFPSSSAPKARPRSCPERLVDQAVIV